MHLFKKVTFIPIYDMLQLQDSITNVIITQTCPTLSTHCSVSHLEDIYVPFHEVGIPPAHTQVASSGISSSMVHPVYPS